MIVRFTDTLYELTTGLRRLERRLNEDRLDGFDVALDRLQQSWTTATSFFSEEMSALQGFGYAVGHGDNHDSSTWGLRDITNRCNDMMRSCATIGDELDALRLRYGFLDGDRFWEEKKYSNALDVWERVLPHKPGHTGIHRRLADFIGLANGDDGAPADLHQRARDLRARYCLQEDIGYHERITRGLGINRVRCVDFDDCGDLYLDDVDGAAVVKISSGGELVWRTPAHRWTREHPDQEPTGFGAFARCDDLLMVTDGRGRQLVFIDTRGEVVRRIRLPFDYPLFTQAVDPDGPFHVSDESMGMVGMVDGSGGLIERYRLPDGLFKPVQLKVLPKQNRMLVALGYRNLGSRIEVFDLSGGHRKTLAVFDQAPCHVVKMDVDNDGQVYAADHFGSIVKIDGRGRQIWQFREKERFDRFKYVRYHHHYIYISDNFVLRRFKVDH